MVQQNAYIQIELERGEAVSLLRAEGCELRCVRGRLWVTEQNGGGDVVLDAGDAYPLSRRGRTVVQAVGKDAGACCQVLLDRSPRAAVSALRRLVPTLASRRTTLRLVLPGSQPA